MRSYSIGDAYARFRRGRGDDVLFSFGYDAFGLPAELVAIEQGVPAADWVERCAEHMTGQLERLGFSLDWERTFLSSDPKMYRWSQWLFLRMLEAGLIYRGTSSVDWCDHCQTTLASIQVEAGGTCWRCHNPVRLVELPQWFRDQRLRRGERPAPRRAARDRDLGRGRTAHPGDRARPRRRRRARADGDAAPSDASRLTPRRAGAPLRADLAARPDAERWAPDGGARAVRALRAGGWERNEREAETIPVIETGHDQGPTGEPFRW